MRSRAITLLTTAATALTLVLAMAPASAGPGPGHFSSDNVEWISVNPRHTGTSGGKLLGKYFYVTDPRGVSIYDVSDPAAPVLTGSLNVFMSGTGVALGQEDPDTNGEILLVDAIDLAGGATSARMLVVDVKDKSAPKVISSIGLTDHTWTCVDSCRYAYGRTGYIIDLTDPKSPKEAGNWKTGNKSPGYTHDFTEIRPGRVMSSGQHSYYFDSTDPRKPRWLNEIKTSFSSLGYHSNLWPRQGRDSLMLMGTEIAPYGPAGGMNAGTDCQGDGILVTYDATSVRAADEYVEANPGEPRPASAFTKLSEWKVSGRGAYADGKAPFNTLYCTHWFDTNPSWEDGGHVALAYYDWGTRFLKVGSDGKFTEAGWFQPVGGYTASAYFITDEIVYAMDYRRGMDVLRFKPTAG